ncbi:GntR family transcriptional regulator [Marininema mesophilum]|uniref:GntR family transcriptional regulator n=1 Tax=Marininema mesophilum TaxID=1048340 RepID=A0A1H2VPB2_9BACL|nr:GntR family transcriptional regulator [Marininema mesophilum]SDW70212.1 GntR family transcriptional regulator [Marininema mesophilum]
MAVQYESTSPIYLQLAEKIRRQILRHELTPGEKLPSVRDMAVQSSVNPNTVQRTYSELERMGIVESRRGQGTFITENEERLETLRDEMRETQIASFVQGMKEMGFASEEILSGLTTYLNNKKGESNQ